MKTKLFNLIIAIAMFTFLNACDQVPNDAELDQMIIDGNNLSTSSIRDGKLDQQLKYPDVISDIYFHNITGEVTGFTDCKNFSFSDAVIEFAPVTSVVQYKYEPETKRLFIKRINAGFNCCPKKIFCNFSFMNNRIHIQEMCEEFLCECNCLFDFDIVLNNVEPQKYQINFDELFAMPKDEHSFEVDFTKTTEGTDFSEREYYPWWSF